MPKDPDLGWHLKYGEYFFQNHQILRDNIFSTEMPNFKFVNHSWATDLITYLVFNWGGFWGLSAFSSLVLTLTFYFFSKTSKLTLLQEVFIFPIVLLLEAAFLSNSFRSQLLSYLMISIVLYLLSKDDKRHLFFIPLVFFIWANLHGQFIMGLALFLLWALFKITLDFLKNKKGFLVIISKTKIYGIVFLASILLTLINPFGLDIYIAVFKYSTSSLQPHIQEWSPVEYRSLFWWYLYIWLFVISISSLVLIYKKKLWENIFYIVVAFLFLLISFKVRRYIWISYFMSIPLIAGMFDLLEKRLTKFKASMVINVVLIICLLFLVLVKIPDLRKTTMNWDTYCLHTICSPKSAEFLENYHGQYTLFSEYNLGGWLIWNYPKIKPLIDGRMTFWEDTFGYSAFKNYIDIENNVVDIDKTKYDLVYMSPFHPLIYRLIELVKEDKWAVIYSDPNAIIIRRK